MSTAAFDKTMTCEEIDSLAEGLANVSLKKGLDKLFPELVYEIIEWVYVGYLEEQESERSKASEASAGLRAFIRNFGSLSKSFRKAYVEPLIFSHVKINTPSIPNLDLQDTEAATFFESHAAIRQTRFSSLFQEFLPQYGHYVRSISLIMEAQDFDNIEKAISMLDLYRITTVKIQLSRYFASWTSVLDLLAKMRNVCYLALSNGHKQTEASLMNSSRAIINCFPNLQSILLDQYTMSMDDMKAFSLLANTRIAELAFKRTLFFVDTEPIGPVPPVKVLRFAQKTSLQPEHLCYLLQRLSGTLQDIQIWDTRLDDAFAIVSQIGLNLPHLARLLVHNAPCFTADMLETLRLTPIQNLALSKTAVTLTDLSCLLVPETNLPHLKKVYYQPLARG